MATAPPLPKSFEDARLRHIEVEEELERICAAVHFRASKRACEFLRYVVRVALDGRMDSLKERSIGIDLLGRDVSYDPSSDAIVRVRANDVRKRLSSYYASADAASSVRINLPTGTYIPCFVSGISISDRIETSPVIVTTTESPKALTFVAPLSRMTRMRPALMALLIYVLLMRHRLEDRDSYLRFWDHVLGGRNVLLLAIAPQDEMKLASSLYPVAWIAGRYGVDTAIEGGSPSEDRPGQFATVQESLVTPPALAGDKRLRWFFTEQTGENRIGDRAALDRIFTGNISSAALLTILPEDTATLHIQGTDSDAMEHILENLTSQKHFPDGVIDQLNNRYPLQVLMLRNRTGQWETRIYSGDR
jgi:hypothetical protein